MNSSTLKYLPVFTLACCSALTACNSASEVDGDGDGGDGSGESTLELTSWWSGPGEAEALTALLDVHKKKFPKTRVFNSSENDGSESELTIEQRLAEGEPPDLFQENAADIPELLDAFPGSLLALDELFEKNGWNDVFLPEVLEAITFDKHIYAMPVGVHRENGLFINQELFKEYELSPPKTVPELLTLCESLAAEDVTCLATGGQGWIVRIMFLDLMMGIMGGSEYNKFFSGNGDPDDAKFAEAIDTLRLILDNYIDEDLWITKDCVDFDGNEIDKCLDGASGWQEASQSLFDHKTAMFLHGDWVGGYVQQLGWEAGIDYTVIGAPGASDTFVFGVDVFALPTEAKNQAGALAFFETIGSLEGQAAFNNIKGSTPVRLDADVSLLTPVGKAALADLKEADIVMKSPTFLDMDSRILDFANGAISKAELIEYFREGLY